jgi:hypothetical protein
MTRFPWPLPLQSEFCTSRFHRPNLSPYSPTLIPLPRQVTGCIRPKEHFSNADPADPEGEGAPEARRNLNPSCTHSTRNAGRGLTVARRRPVISGPPVFRRGPSGSPPVGYHRPAGYDPRLRVRISAFGIRWYPAGRPSGGCGVWSRAYGGSGGAVRAAVFVTGRWYVAHRRGEGGGFGEGETGSAGPPPGPEVRESGPGPI